MFFLKLTPRSENLFAIQGFQADHASQRPIAVMEQFSLRSFQLALATKTPFWSLPLETPLTQGCDETAPVQVVWVYSLVPYGSSHCLSPWFPRPSHANWSEPMTDVTFWSSLEPKGFPVARSWCAAGCLEASGLSAMSSWNKVLKSVHWYVFTAISNDQQWWCQFKRRDCL